MQSIDKNANCGIYQIRNIINNDIYIGSSSKINRRFNTHKCRLRKGKQENPYLQSAWNKYGEENFVFEIILICHPDMLIWYEQQFLDQWNPKYNINKLADSPGSHPVSEEQKIKVSEFHKGRKRTEKTRERMSLARIGIKITDGARENMRKSRLGKTTSNRQKQIVSQLSKGNEWNAKLFSGIKSPDGIVYDSIFNLSKFCREHNLEARNLSAVIHGKVKSHKGWTYVGGVS